MNKSSIRFLSVVSIGALFATGVVACGSDDETDGGGAGSANDGGSAGSGGKTGTAGKSSSSGGGGVAGETAVNGGSEAAGAGGAGGAETAPKARLRIVHASPSAPSVDIYPKGSDTAAASDVAYGQATDFIDVDAGTIAFDLRATGEEASSDPAFTTADIALDAGADYTLVAAGDFAHLDDVDVGFRVLALQHDFEAPSAGKAVARVVHATTAWAGVDFDVAATTGVDVPGLDPFASESNLELTADAAFDVAFQAGDAVLSKLTFPELAADSELFIVATGNPGFPFRAPANGFALLVVDQAGVVTWVKEQPWIHATNASDISTVDLYDAAHTAAAAKLSDDLAAATLTAFQLPASAAGFTLKAVADDAVSGTATALATGPTSTLEAGEHYLTYIAGNTIQTLHEQFDLEQPTKLMLRGAHASTSIAQTVDFGAVVSNTLSTVLISSVAPSESSAAAGVATSPGNVIFGAATHGLTTLLAQATFSGAAAPVAGERDFALLVGTDKLWLVDTSVAGWTLR